MARQRAYEGAGSLDAPLLTFDISTVLARIKQEAAWQKEERNAITLLKGRGLRVVLVAVHAGKMIPSHRADCPIILEVIEGTIKFSTDARALTLRKGQILTLQAKIPHVIQADEDSAFLLTLAADTAHPAERQAARARE